jgi:hypothetical protein
MIKADHGHSGQIYAVGGEQRDRRPTWRHEAHATSASSSNIPKRATSRSISPPLPPPATDAA